MSDFKEIADFIRENIPECEYVGMVQSDKEVLVSFDTPYYDPGLRREVQKRLVAEFPGVVRRVIEVAKPNIHQLRQDLKTVDALNELVGEEESK